jgi:predicted transcriptional regulator
MPLKLNDLIQKAKDKRINIPDSQKTLLVITRPWQQESTLFATNQQQSEDNLTTNREQTGEKPRTNQGQTRDTTKDKLRTNPGQTRDKLGTAKEIPEQTRDTTEDKLRTNQGQTRDETRDKTRDTSLDFFALSRLQNNITMYIYNMCKISRDKSTRPIAIEMIANSCGTTILAAKKTLQRLEKKGLLIRTNFKNGRGGWTSYCLTNDVFQKILYMETEAKLRTNRGQTKDKLETQLETQLRTTASSSSSIYNIKTTTTDEPENLLFSSLENDWQEIDIEPLKKINFTKTHIAQVASQKLLSVEMVQSSIYAFAFDLEENNKGKNISGDPLSYFMGILRKGMPYTPSSNYESPRDKALRLYRERMRSIEQGRLEAEKEVMNLAFNEWFRQLDEKQKKALLPAGIFRNMKSLENSKILESAARNHFEKTIWSERLAGIVNENHETIDKFE